MANLEGISELYDEPPNLSVATTETGRDGETGRPSIIATISLKENLEESLYVYFLGFQPTIVPTGMPDNCTFPPPFFQA